MKPKFSMGDTVFVQGKVFSIYEGEDSSLWYSVDFNLDGEEPMIAVVEEISVHSVF